MSFTEPGQEAPQAPPPPGAQTPATAQPIAADGPSGPRAGWWVRVGGYILDAIIVDIVNVILFVALKGVGYALGIVVSAAYFTYFYGSPSGQTLGQRALGIRTIDFATGGPIGYGRGFGRWIGLIVSGIPIGLGFLWMLWDKENQTWADKIAGTVVVPVASYPVPPQGS